MQPPNMLSMILSHPDSNETSFTGLQHIAILQLCIDVRLLPVDANTALLDQVACVPTTAAEAGFHQGGYQVLRVGDCAFLDLLRELALAEFEVEIFLSTSRRLFAVKTIDQLARQCGLAVTRFHRQNVALLLGIQAGYEPDVSLDQSVRDRHRLAVDLLGWLRQPDVVAQRLRHLLLAVGALEQRKHRDVLWLLSERLLDLASEQQVEELVGAADLHIGLDGNRVVGLAERIQDLVCADRGP